MLRRQFPKAKGAFYRVDRAPRAEGEPTATDLWVYDVIGDDWAEPSLAARDMCRAIAEISTDEIVLHLASPGGSCSDGIAIYNALTSHPATVASRVEGWTASMATILALAASPGRISMYDNCMFMIHEPAGIQLGNAADMRDYADFLDSVTSLMVGVYMQRSSKPEAELRTALAAETWLNAEQAAEWGFVDEVLTGAAQAAAVGGEAFTAMGFSLPDGAGRTLSAGNEDKLVSARDQIDEVLSTIEARALEAPKAAAGDAPTTIVSKEMASILTASKRI